MIADGLIVTERRESDWDTQPSIGFTVAQLNAVHDTHTELQFAGLDRFNDLLLADLRGCMGLTPC